MTTRPLSLPLKNRIRVSAQNPFVHKSTDAFLDFRWSTKIAHGGLIPQACFISESELHGGSVATGIPPRGPRSGTHSPTEARETSTHLASASILHRGAAASLLDQSKTKLHGGSVAKYKHLLQVSSGGRGGKQALSNRVPQPQRRARTLCPPPSCTVEQPQACSISRETSTQRAGTCVSLYLGCTIEQPQACSISRRSMAAPLHKANT